MHPPPEIVFLLVEGESQNPFEKTDKAEAQTELSFCLVVSLWINRNAVGQKNFKKMPKVSLLKLIIF